MDCTIAPWSQIWDDQELLADGLPSAAQAMEVVRDFAGDGPTPGGVVLGQIGRPKRRQEGRGLAILPATNGVSLAYAARVSARQVPGCEASLG